MDDVALSQLVQHGAHQGKLCCGFSGIRDRAQDANRVAGRLVVETIVQTLLLRLADAL